MKTLPPEMAASIVVDVVASIAIKPWKYKVCECCGAVNEKENARCVCGHYRFDDSQEAVLAQGRVMVSKEPELQSLFEDLRAEVENRSKKFDIPDG